MRGLDGCPDPRSAAPCEWLLDHDVHVLSTASTAYPPLLRRIACPPPVLFVQGAVAVLSSPQVAVVGSRSPTASGRELASELATGLAQYALTVTSGLALGIDSAAHLGALEAGGASVAVMGTGPDQVYPARHRRLAASLLERGGALVTEFVPGTRPEPANFPRRNRIISGLSLGVLVVEAALPSGSLLTAQRALEQDREVMAVPGPVRSPLTSREWEVLDLLCEGRSTDVIAEDLVLSTETVRSHVKGILRKLGVASRDEAVAAARRLQAGEPITDA